MATTHGREKLAQAGRNAPAAVTQRSANDSAPPAKAMRLSDAILQAKLSVGPADDVYEREADSVADQVVQSLREGTADERDQQAPGTSAVVGRVQRATPIGAEGGAIDADTDREIQSRRGGGRAMPMDARRQMEGAFGADFSGVRVHEGSDATELNNRIQAKAFTVGNDVFFRDGVPDTNSAAGQHLLAHELTHTIQQTGPPSGDAQRVVQRFGKSKSKSKSKPAAPAEATIAPAVAKTYPYTGDLHGEAVEFEKASDETEAELIYARIKDDYGITIKSDKLSKAIKTSYKDAAKSVTDGVVAQAWKMKELRALVRALAHFAPILGGDRKKSKRRWSGQEVKFIGKVKQSIDVENDAYVLDNTTMGEYFKKDKTFGMFAAGTESTEDFTDNLKQLEATAVHEMAHGLFGYMEKKWVKEFTYWESANNPSGKSKAEEPPSEYGKTNASEDLCESVMFFFVDEGRLKTSSPLRHKFVQKMVDGWKKTEKKKKAKK